jgi:hypothetical protein
MSEKSSATGGAVAGNCAYEGRGEHGRMGLGSSIGDDVGESDNNDAGREYTELASDRRCPRTGESLAFGVGGLEGKAAWSRGSNFSSASSAVSGITMPKVECLLFLVSKILLSVFV